MFNKRGQTALILILLTAATLIFLAITLNWGRVAQIKAFLTVAADQGASLLASETASYGEMQKQTYLHDTNQLVFMTSVIMAIIMVIVAIISLFIPGGQVISALAWASLALSVVNLVLQVVVVQPMITSIWNKLQLNQPTQQQFYEQGITTALQSSVTDQVKITDYFDLNTNGLFGATGSVPNDSISRFAFFYTERLKMLNKILPPIPQVQLFYNQLGELMNGETCDENANDINIGASMNPQVIISPNPACAALGCTGATTDPICAQKIPNSFQLNDTCTASNPANATTYNPYCDPCCVPLCDDGSACANNQCSDGSTCNHRPSSCNQSPIPPAPQCSENNPYGASYPFLYDASFQNYTDGVSFLDQFGRDQQMGPFSSLTPNVMSPIGVSPILEFPNGIYPFFWLMNQNLFSPEVDNINSGALQAGQDHWCTIGAPAPAVPTPTGFPDLAQLSLPYSCVGPDCCVNYLGNAANGVIDLVGSPTLGPNPSADPSFGYGNSGQWIPGDSQLCLASWPYNGSSDGSLSNGTCAWNDTGGAASPPPGANSTIDALDDAMHTLSDFDVYANNLLNKSVSTLSSTFQTWYPQVAPWISATCDDSSACTNNVCSDGTMCNRLPPVITSLNAWEPVITNWLKINYANAGAWCLPPNTTGSANEDAYINSNDNGGPWGNISSVIACENYNASTPVSNYQACVNYVTSACPASGSSLAGTPCDPAVLGRSLAGAAPAYDGCSGQYILWAQSSLTLATDQAPKFALRAQFLNDVYTRATTMQTMFSQGAIALQGFMSGAASQLSSAQAQTPVTETIPNAVIYGWQDGLPSGGSGGCMDSNGTRVGCSHIVKITAYSTGRCGGYCNGTDASPGIDNLLPWVKTTTSGFLNTTRKYTLTDRDGYAYISVRRWDQDHSNPILFPNGRPVWQFMFENPKTGQTSGQGLIGACQGLFVPGGGNVGFGLTPQTLSGLGFTSILPQDVTSLANAFMLNDEADGTGNVDPSAKGNPAYDACLTQANNLLANAPESHACAEYVASDPGQSVAGGKSQNGDMDYSIKYIDCSNMPGGPPPDDLQG